MTGRLRAVAAALRRAWLLALGFAMLLAPAGAFAWQDLTRADMHLDAGRLPLADDPSWTPVDLPDLWRQSRPGQLPAASWYRANFTLAATAAQPWAVFLPYLYDGGEIWVNGALVARFAESTPQVRVRWLRPQLVTVPPALLRPGDNVLLVRAGQPPPGGTLRFPRLRVGTEAELRPLHDRQFFWVRVTPQITVTVCLLAGLAVLSIWWRRRAEVRYGLFGLAVLLWGVRTLTLVVEAVPESVYPAWRLLLHAATGGFIVVMTMLAWRLAGIRRPWFERAILAYWLAGPLWLLAQGSAAEPLVNRYWVGGLLPIGGTIVAVTAWSVVRRRKPVALILSVTLALGALAGMHDYAVAWDLLPPLPWLQEWAAQRLQLLHLTADLVLLAMAGLLAARFVRALRALEHVNGTLEARVADRERELAANGGRVRALERERASERERRRILREIHDALGTQLFVSLARLERGDMTTAEVADTLRRCIAEMRLALDTVGPQALDFRSTLGNFLFRWRDQLLACGIRPTWDIDVPDDALAVSPQATLQLLRVLQEALSNVVQHAQASAVDVQLRLRGGQLQLEVRDDGLGAAAVSDSSFGRGLNDMRTRAAQLGGRCEVHGGSGGTCVRLQVPWRTVRV